MRPDSWEISRSSWARGAGCNIRKLIRPSNAPQNFSVTSWTRVRFRTANTCRGQTTTTTARTPWPRCYSRFRATTSAKHATSPRWSRLPMPIVNMATPVRASVICGARWVRTLADLTRWRPFLRKLPGTSTSCDAAMDLFLTMEASNTARARPTTTITTAIAAIMI